ncbi:unnamed protein product [Meganyctiphanes norvegica]|uniref:Condensation domain-containing protein n=1 Tax=Meganyctiphanes norvegica TaxID=48144 RepID=A0AAV2RH39_MEGNR
MALRTAITTIGNTLPRSAAAGVVPWHLSHTKRRGNQLYEAFIKHFSSNELIHGTSEWQIIRPATPEETSYEKFHRNYARQAIGGFIFNSRTAIGEELWSKSLRHLSNKIQALRLCLQEREEKLMLCEVKNHDIDFKMVENKTVLEALDDMQNEGLDNSFWSVRIVPGGVCGIPEIREEFPHQYTFYLKTHHGLMDGISMVFLIRVFTEILDDVLSGKIVNDDVKLGKLTLFDDPLQIKIKETQQALESDQIRLKEEKERMLTVTKKQPILYSAFPKPKGIQSTTKHIVKVVDTSKVNAFYKSCKLKKINMTAGFEALFNTALVEMVSDAGAAQDGFQINIRQIVNMRRYFKVEKDLNKLHIGNFLGGMQQGTFCRKLARKNFWEHAQGIHNNFHSLLKNNGPFIELIVRPQVQGPLDPLELAKGPSRDYSDYAFSNVLDLTPFAFYEGKHVQITDIISYNFIHNYLHPMLFQLATYRGLGQLTCSYDTAKVAHDTAHELMDRIINLLDFVTK